MKILLRLLVILLPFIGLAQESTRVSIPGVITAPAGEDVEAISVYNNSTDKGTVTNAQGEFTLEVALNDRVQVTALQYKTFTIIITEKDLIQKKLSIYLNPFVNKLEEVIVRSTDLSGYAELDAKNIQTHVYIPDLDLSLDAVRFGYDFERDRYTGVDGNAAEDALGLNDVPMASVDLGELMKLFFPKKKKSSVEIVNLKQLKNVALWSRYTPAYLSEAYNISEDKIVDFIYYAEEHGMTMEMLKPENEIRLLAFLLETSEKYKEQLNGRD